MAAKINKKSVPAETIKIADNWNRKLRFYSSNAAQFFNATHYSSRGFFGSAIAVAVVKTVPVYERRFIDRHIIAVKLELFLLSNESRHALKNYTIRNVPISSAAFSQ